MLRAGGEGGGEGYLGVVVEDDVEGEERMKTLRRGGGGRKTDREIVNTGFDGEEGVSFFRDVGVYEDYGKWVLASTDCCINFYSGKGGGIEANVRVHDLIIRR